MLWADWYPDILPRVPGCPDVVVEHEMLRAAQRLLDAADIWVDLAGPYPVAAGQATVTLSPSDAQAEIARVDSLWLDGRRLTPVAPSGLGPNWPERSGRTDAYFMEAPARVRLCPAPDIDALSGLAARTRLRPSDTATGLPDMLAGDVRQTVLMGALAALYLDKAKPWGNPDLAVVAAQSFAAGVADFTVRAARAGSNGRIPSTIRWC